MSAYMVPKNQHGTWVGITKATIKQLNNLQRWFIRLVLQVPQGTPTAALTWETGLMEMGLRVQIEKLLLVLHIRSLDEETLARKIYEEQKQQLWPGLATETKDICKDLDIEDVNETNLSKKEYKKLAVEATKKQDEKELRSLGEKSEKCNRILEDSYGKKEYFMNENIHKTRQYFRTRVNMHKFAGNFSKDRSFARTGWKCRCGLEREEVSHLTSGTCPTYRDIYERYSDLSSDDALTRFFGEVLARRDALDQQE